MALYIYEKYLPPPPPTPLTPFQRLLYFSPLILSLVGILLVGSVVWPVLSYEFKDQSTTPIYSTSGLLNPLIDASTKLEVLAAPQVVGDTDFTQITNWFPNAPIGTPISSPVSTYTISIPKLKIDHATVRIDTTDLNHNLAQYPGTSLPGQLGAPVVFGHSILPQFFNPKNYLSIFSLLPTLVNGDQIIVDYDNVTYTYTVSSKVEVLPTDVWVLQQDFDAKRLKLITCVPPGLKLRRLVVTATLSNS